MGGKASSFFVDTIFFDTKVSLSIFLAVFDWLHISLIISLPKVLPCHWALLTLPLLLGLLDGSEGKMFQETVKARQDHKVSKRWLPLPADSTYGAEKDPGVVNQEEESISLVFAEQSLTNQPGDGDLVQRTQYNQDDILKRRHGFSQVNEQCLNRQINKASI